MSLWQIIRDAISAKPVAGMSTARAWQIVGDYAVEMQKVLPTVVRDAKRLPHPKSVIKQALLTVIRDFPSNTQMQAGWIGRMDAPPSLEPMKVGYVALARWQDGVGEHDLGFDLVLAMTSDEGLAEARRRRELGSMILDAAKAEERELRDDLRRLGMGEVELY